MPLPFALVGALSGAWQWRRLIIPALGVLAVISLLGYAAWLRAENDEQSATIARQDAERDELVQLVEREREQRRRSDEASARLSRALLSYRASTEQRERELEALAAATPEVRAWRSDRMVPAHARRLRDAYRAAIGGAARPPAPGERKRTVRAPSGAGR